MTRGFAGFLAGLRRILQGLPLALAAPVFLVCSAIALFLTDLITALRSPNHSTDQRASTAEGVSIVIPNWNGRDLLEKYLPSVVTAAAKLPGSEVLVVDNGSDDGSAEFVRERFPQVRLLALEKNLGFGEGSNAGFRAARHDVVVLLNSDMRVDPEFLRPLVDPFSDERTFAVSCQIFFSDSNKLRQETGLTEGWWQQGCLRVGHRNEPEIREAYPCFYPGGGSSAFDRRKFLELGGFDKLYHPFYVEDTDLGYQAWKRGWKVLYQPASIVYHEHRGTIGKRFSEEYIRSVLQRNFILFAWKNIHGWDRLLSHLGYSWAAATLSWIAGAAPDRATYKAIARSFFALPRAMASRARAFRLARIDDTEAFRRPLGGYFRDTFAELETRPQRPSVLFVSPYPICPPVHGGGVFMYQTVRELARLTDLHVIVLLDYERERTAHAELDRLCASTQYIVRMEGRQKALGSIEPHAVREFRNRDLAWMIHRTIYTKRVDVLQLEYTVLGQYAGGYRRIPSILFEHDVYFQSIARRLPFMTSPLERLSARWEYLRALRYELKLLKIPDRIQVCSQENAEYLCSFLPELRGRIDSGYRAGIDTALYPFHTGAREPWTLLFLGSFRHLPNVEALNWFVKEVFPKIRAGEPRAKLIVIGSDPPPRHSLRGADSIELIGFVEDIRRPLSQYSVFVCPILSGSGVRVKLLEAFAAGIPVVSTHLGAEGLAAKDGEICALADDPAEFAARTLDLLRLPDQAAKMAQRARNYVVESRDMRCMTARMLEGYRAQIEKMRA
jgi:GT2 family glycosyltransferase